MIAFLMGMVMACLLRLTIRAATGAEIAWWDPVLHLAIMLVVIGLYIREKYFTQRRGDP